jgi:hypothetical protein
MSAEPQKQLVSSRRNAFFDMVGVNIYNALPHGQGSVV